MSTYAALLKEGEGRLLDAGIEEGRLDAWYLFSDCFSMDKGAYFLRMNEEASCGGAVSRFESLIEGRCRRIPLQQLLGNQEFMGLSFAVNEHVLIPRQDTETLVETVLEDLRREQDGKFADNKDRFRILDLCTGSGCIGISLAKYLDRMPFQIILSDISGEALRTAKENIRRLGVKQTCRTVQSDLFEAFAGEAFDCIVSNPPYIPTKDIEELSPEVRDHEPRLALDGSGDGLAVYRRIAACAGEHLLPGGRIYLEIGWDQGSSVPELFRAAGFTDIEVIRDLTGKDRVVKMKIRRNSHV